MSIVAKAAEDWVVVHEADIIVEETKEVIGYNKIELDRASIRRKDDLVVYRLRKAARSFSIEVNSTEEQAADCKTGMYRPLKSTDIKTGKTLSQLIPRWRKPEPPYNDKVHKLVCS